MQKILLSLLLIGCNLASFGCAPWSTDYSDDHQLPDYELAQDIIVDAWKEKFDYVTNASADGLENYTLVEMNLRELNDRCSEYNPQHPPKSIACHVWISNTEEYVYIYNGATAQKKECALVHELIHMLASYDFNDPQGEHDDPALWNEFGDESLESEACTLIQKSLH